MRKSTAQVYSKLFLTIYKWTCTMVSPSDLELLLILILILMLPPRHFDSSSLSLRFRERLASCSTCFPANFNFFIFLLKLSAVYTFWIVLMCWYQKWFLKNKKTSLACISARKAIWKATTTTLPNTLLVIG